MNWGTASRRMTFELNKEGRGVNRKRVRRLMRVMGIEGLVPRPGTSKAAPGHKIYPYLAVERKFEMQFVDTAHHGQIVRSGDRLGAVDPRARQAQQHALAAHRQVVARPFDHRSSIGCGALIALASWPRNPVRQSVGRSWRKAWPSRARAPPRHPPNRSPLGRIGSPHCREPASSKHKSGSDAPVPLRQLRNRRILAQRLKRNLRLERRIKLLA